MSLLRASLSDGEVRPSALCAARLSAREEIIVLTAEDVRGAAICARLHGSALGTASVFRAPSRLLSEARRASSAVLLSVRREG